ncbi:MAG: outer membrane beta-barrel protein [Woeseia sp.]
MQKSLAAIVLGIALSAPAVAQSDFYLGGTIGNTSVDTEFDEFDLNFDDEETSWSAFAGIQATDNFAIEASYNDFGDYNVSRNFDLTQTNIDATLTGYDVMAVLSAPIGPLRLFGKAGLVFWDADVTALIQPPVGSGFQLREQDSGNDLAFGGGLEFSLSPNLAIRGEMEWFDIEDTEEVWFASIGLRFNF